MFRSILSPHPATARHTSRGRHPTSAAPKDPVVFLYHPPTVERRPKAAACWISLSPSSISSFLLCFPKIRHQKQCPALRAPSLPVGGLALPLRVMPPGLGLRSPVVGPCSRATR
jgi:hypothetical protein